MIKKLLAAIFIFSSSLLVPATAFAIPVDDSGGSGCTNFFTCLGNIHDPTNGTFGGGQGLPAKIINGFLPAVLVIAGFITVIIIIVSGIQFITSSGNPEAAGSARSRLIYALIGFAIIILAFAILQIVNTIFLGNTGIV